jgi:sulfatase maturation enzyme AslB (radical SAM superfamily)
MPRYTSVEPSRISHAVIDMARRAGNSVLAVQFFGGEPLLNWQAM